MNYFMLFYRAVFITVFCFGRLPQMDAMRKKKMVNLYLFPVYLRQVYIVLVLTSTNQKARNRYPANGYGPDCLWPLTYGNL